jgi:hypothetical protein
MGAAPEVHIWPQAEFLWLILAVVVSDILEEGVDEELALLDVDPGEGAGNPTASVPEIARRGQVLRSPEPRQETDSGKQEG